MSKAEEAIRRFIEDLEKIDVRPKPAARILPWPKPLGEMELCRRQAVIDATWERVIAARQALEAEVAFGKDWWLTLR